MWVIDSPRARFDVAVGWLIFAAANTTLMYLFPGAETIPFHFVWASYAFLYGVAEWPRVAAWPAVIAIMVISGAALVHHAAVGTIAWEECAEIPLMPLIVGLLVWHVDRDTAARRRLAQLRDRDRLKAEHRELATRFGSHEIRTRLTIARGLVEMIADDQDTLQWMSRDCRIAAVELDKATKITNNLLTFVRADDTSLGVVGVDLDELLEDVGFKWRSTADRDWEITSRAGVQMADPERFEAAVDCLVENAVKFTEPGDRIAVEAHVEDRTLILSVSDSGSGIPPEDLDQVTELFHTSASAGSRAGTGIGLAIVRAMTAARGGTMNVSSTLGRGTTVTLRLPDPHPGAVRPPGSTPWLDPAVESAASDSLLLPPGLSPVGGRPGPRPPRSRTGP